MGSEIMQRLLGEVQAPPVPGYTSRGSRELARRSERLDIESQLAVLKLYHIDNAVGVATTTEMKTQMLCKAAEMAAPDGAEGYAVYRMAGITAKAATITELGRLRP